MSGAFAVGDLLQIQLSNDGRCAAVSFVLFPVIGLFVTVVQRIKALSAPATCSTSSAVYVERQDRTEWRI
jgi:hypothetical protein